jgi:hypothetical protein
MQFLKESGVTSMYEELKKGIKSADHTQIRYPTYTPDVARIIRRMLEVYFFEEKKLYGVFHWQADEQITKYDMVKTIADILDMDASQVQPSSTPLKFPGPPDSRLDCTRLAEDLNIDPAHYRTSFREALRHVFKLFFAEGYDESPPHSCSNGKADSLRPESAGSSATEPSAVVASARQVVAIGQAECLRPEAAG